MKDVREIPLTQGQTAIVDEIDYERVSQFRWYAAKDRHGFRAARQLPRSNGKRSIEYLHNLILRPADGLQVDHINRNPLDNRRSNLRLVTIQQNACNRKYKKYRHGYKGICWFAPAKKFQAQITANGKHRFLGYYATAIEAAKAYDAAARELHGNFAALNFPGETP